eukprot:CAMPEP_0114255610 /NCGR_PEP_ID=MMETSP0058-20121206/17660_1 /TAXON_ID=36894 /ORGANISM="Pyramimonas parkeae, CCMP726" /LENGTH=309 /DNA_ID=CAMNT_0001370019 /DNA_START=88 /DNA_END=1014 /DNA_ORIENTATION=+
MQSSAQYSVPGGWGGQGPPPPEPIPQATGYGQQQHQHQNMHHRQQAGHPPNYPQSGGFDLNSSGGGSMDPQLEAMQNLAKVGFGAYGEKIYGKGHSFVSKYLPGHGTMYPYMNVNQKYVFAKMRMLLCPYLVKGEWVRTPKQTAAVGTSYQNPRQDVQAPDLYLPMMGFFTYCIVASFANVISGKFAPEMLRSRVSTGLMAWLFATLCLWGGLKTISHSQATIKTPLLDLVAYSGYLFFYLAVEVLLGLVSPYAYYISWLWCTTAGAVFLVKTAKRTVYSEANGHAVDTTMTNYVLLCVAGIQFPLSYW